MYLEKNETSIEPVKHRLYQDFEESFSSFLSFLQDKPHINLDNFYRNAKTVKVRCARRDDEMPIPTAYAAYSVDTNELVYRDQMFYDTIDHELLHMSSTFKGKNNIHFGFSQYDPKTGTVVADGFNEAYTSLLDERYFSEVTPTKKETIASSYSIIRLFAENIENIIGREEMEKWYFDGDLYSLVATLCDYMPEKSIYDFFYNIDTLNKYTIADYGKLGTIRLCHAFSKAIRFVVETYMYHYLYNYHQGNLSLQELKVALEELKGYSRATIKLANNALGKSKPVSEKEFNKLLVKTNESVQKNV